MSKQNNKPRRVDFFIYPDDYECAFLGALGMSTRAIEHKTGLTPGKITYRLKKATIKRMDYRNGTSQFAAIILRQARPTINRELRDFLKVHGS